MKIFWSCIALLLLGLLVAFAVPNGGSSAGSTPGVRPALPEPAAARTTAPLAESSSEPAAIAAASDSEAPSDAPAPVLGADSPAALNGDPVQTAEVSFSEVLASLSGAPLVLPEVSAENAPSIADEAASIADEIANDLAGSDTAAAASADAVEASDPLTVRDVPDGATAINDRFVLTGSGSRADPYQVTWEYLTSARESYLPREGKTDIPPHISMLEGKYVSIGGYLQFPLATPEPKELLVMLNQWDGCCLGVPPTPYDAIEVSLSTPANQGERFAVEGAIVGRLKVDPYLVGDWLIGLYLIGDASLDVSGSRSAEEVYGNSPTVGDPNGMHLGR